MQSPPGPLSVHSPSVPHLTDGDMHSVGSLLVDSPPPSVASSSRQSPQAAVVPSIRASHWAAHLSALAWLQMSPALAMEGCSMTQTAAQRGSSLPPVLLLLPQAEGTNAIVETRARRGKSRIESVSACALGASSGGQNLLRAPRLQSRDAGMHVEARSFRDLRALGCGAKAVPLERHGHAAFREAERGAVDQRQLHARFERGALGRLVRVVFGGALVDKAAAAQPSNHALFNAYGDGGEVGTRGRRTLSKHDGGARSAARYEPGAGARSSSLAVSTRPRGRDRLTRSIERPSLARPLLRRASRRRGRTA